MSQPTMGFTTPAYVSTGKTIQRMQQAIQRAVPGIDMQTWSVFTLVAQHPGIKVGELLKIANTDLTMAGMSRLLARLDTGKLAGGRQEGYGLLERRHNPLNRREVLLRLSPKGEKLLEELDTILRKHT